MPAGLAAIVRGPPPKERAALTWLTSQYLPSVVLSLVRSADTRAVGRSKDDEPSLGDRTEDTSSDCTKYRPKSSRRWQRERTTAARRQSRTAQPRGPAKRTGSDLRAGRVRYASPGTSSSHLIRFRLVRR